MKTLLSLISVLAILAVFSQDSFAAKSKKDWTQTPYGVPVAKIGRGTMNIVKAPLDVPATVVRRVKQSKGIFGAGKAVVVGTAEGVACGGARALAGAAEIITFPLVNDTQPLYESPLGKFPARSRQRQTATNY